MFSMKILHTSDWHLGQNFMGKSRLEEHEAFLSWLLNVVEDEEVDLLLVSGDIFDTGTPPNYAQELYYNFLTKLTHITTLKSTIVQLALNQLQSSGKMVGVISHVKALKERIPLQIKVEPKGDGTSVLDLN